ncbi:hypothetical protein [Sphingomonas crusticola]|uniref:hypothetical protein n=1 Tax=Sphingomonas crusticola TaxID=1697973 RepID=UPI000E21C932|nr:hypothetical protein [Sphingomonas crusticola]
MKIAILAAIAAAVSTGAIAQEHDQRGSHNPVVKDSRVHAVPTPARGRSSFTENQAKGRIPKAGFTNIGDLRKTSAGSWQGRAMRHRHAVIVTLDYKGNVTAR